MGSGCGTFASSNPLEGDIDYSYWPKVGQTIKRRTNKLLLCHGHWRTDRFQSVLLGRTSLHVADCDLISVVNKFRALNFHG